MSARTVAAGSTSWATRTVVWSRSFPLALGLVVAGSTAWAGLFLVTAVERHESVRSHRFDLGNMVQVVWSTAHGRPFEMTLGTGEQASRLGVHVDPILGLFAPL
jgi:uncharacterized membrane protein